jgi:hypothetical protein
MAGLGGIWLDAHADTSKLGPELERGAKAAASEAEKGNDFDGLVKASDKAGSRSGDEFGKSFIRDASGRLRDEQGRFVSEGKDIGDKLGNAVSDGNDSALKKRISRLGGLLAPDWIKSIGVWITALAPAALELASTLAPAAGIAALIVPAALGAAASMGILKVAFSGVGAAIKAVNGPVKDFQKALKGLTPAQRDFVMEVKAVQPELKKFKTIISQSFFEDFQGSVTKLGKTLLPALTYSLSGIATTLGYVGERLVDILTKKSSIADLNKIFNLFSYALGKIGDALPYIVSAFLKIGASAAPYLADVAGYIERIAKSFNSFISGAQKSGAFTNFLNNAEVALKQIEILGKDVYTIVSSILSAAGQAGGGAGLINTLSTIADVIKKLSQNGGLGAIFATYNTVFQSLGKVIGPLLAPLGKLLKTLGGALGADVKTLTPALVDFVNNGMVPLLNTVTDLVPVLNPVVIAMAKLLGAITANPGVTKAVLVALITYFTVMKTIGVVGIIEDIVVAFQAWIVAALGLDVALDANPIGLTVIAIAALVAGIYVLIRYINNLVQSIGGWGALWKDIVNGLKIGLTAVENFFIMIGTAIANFFTKQIPEAFNQVVAFVQSLPGRILGIIKTMLSDILIAIGVYIGLWIAAFELFPKAVSRVFHAVVDAIHSIISGIPGFISNIVSKLVHAWDSAPSRINSAIVSVISKVKSIFNRAWDAGVAATKSGVSSLIKSAATVPGRIVALGGKLYSAGVSIIKRLFSGIANGGNIGQVAGSIVSRVRSGLNSAIRKVNSGINSLHIPGVHLPNIPYLAKGGIIRKPTLALIGERNPEVVLPTDNPMRARQLLMQSGLAASLNMGTPDVYVNVQIGQQPINDIVSNQISYSNTQTATQLAYGTRG